MGNDCGYGKGPLIIMNLNREPNAEEILKFNYSKALEHVSVEIQTPREKQEKVS